MMIWLYDDDPIISEVTDDDNIPTIQPVVTGDVTDDDDDDVTVN